MNCFKVAFAEWTETSLFKKEFSVSLLGIVQAIATVMLIEMTII